MNWQDVVKTVAPTLGTALGGPMAGAATKFIADKLLGNPNASEDEVETFMLGSSSADMLKLQELDKSFKLEMKKLKIDVFALEVKDRDSARGLYKINIWPQIVLSAMFILGYFTIVYLLFSGGVDIKDSIRDVSNVLLGVMTAAIPQILNFWFGSSLGSKEKTAASK